MDYGIESRFVFDKGCFISKASKLGQRGLLRFLAHGKKPQEELKKTLETFQDFGILRGVSPVFRIFEEIRTLSIVAMVDLERPHLDLISFFSEIESSYSVTGGFLILEDVIAMRPDMPIPDPEFHKTAHWLIPASELWPDAIHPVLKQSLSELVTQLPPKPWGEFVSQGKTLLDFSE